MDGMDDDNEDEHNFSDDGFDAFEDTALRELENNAILSTQQVRAQSSKHLQQRPLQPQPRRPSGQVVPARPILRDDCTVGDEYDNESFEWIGDDRVSTPVQEAPLIIQQRRPPGETTQREQWRNQRFGRSSVHHQALPQPVYRPQHANYQHPPLVSGAYNGQHPRQIPQPAPVEPPKPQAAAPVTSSEQQDGLLARIQELMKERDGLTTELHDAKQQVMTHKGEISIIRENKVKETKVLDRQMFAMKKGMQEELTKSRTAMEALAKRNSEMTSQNDFLNRELAQEAEKTRSLEIRLRERPTERPTGPNVTPRKVAGNSLRDGFDDDEVMVLSPAKSARRSKPPTPAAANKRKRKADVQSPIKPLVLRHSADAFDADTVANIEPEMAQKPASAVRKDRKTERHLRFMQSILNYKLAATGSRLLETLVKHSFPSDQTQTISSIVLERTSTLAGPRLPADLLQIFLDVWSRCLKEKYYDCVGMLIEIVDYILDIQMSIFDKSAISALLPVLQDSISINAEIRFKHSPVFHKNQNVGRPTPKSALNQAIDGTTCLKLLYKIACVISSEFTLIDHFWRSLSTDFILMLLNPWQPISDITLTFSLLSTSIFPLTFGNICADEPTQTKMEKYILDRVCYMLWETPKVDEGLPTLSKITIAQFRLAAMDLLTHLAITSSLPPYDDAEQHGSLLLANHPSAIARLVRSLYDSVAVLYTCPSPQLTNLYSTLINKGVCLLYHLTTLHANKIDLAKKLSAVNGGVNKHRVVLTRLAFSEGWYIDREVSDESVTMATAMLEESVTPDEAETLIEAFPGFVGRKRNREQGHNSEEEMEIDEQPEQGKG